MDYKGVNKLEINSHPNIFYPLWFLSLGSTLNSDLTYLNVSLWSDKRPRSETIYIYPLGVPPVGFFFGHRICTIPTRVPAQRFDFYGTSVKRRNSSTLWRPPPVHGSEAHRTAEFAYNTAFSLKISRRRTEKNWIQKEVTVADDGCDDQDLLQGIHWC